MNLKTLIALLMLPLSAFGFTNKIDNLWVPGNFRYSTGAAAGSIFTSDASGNASWSVAGASGDVFLNGMTTTKMNNYTAGTSNFFRGPVMLGNDNISPLIFISAGTAATNIVERHRMYIDTASGNVWKLDSTAGTAMTEDFGRITINQLFRTLDGAQIGDAAGDPLTIISATWAIPNNASIGSGAFYISNAFGAAVNAVPAAGNRFTVNTPVTSMSSASSIFSGLSNQVPLVAQGAVSQVSNLFSVHNSAGLEWVGVNSGGTLTLSQSGFQALTTAGSSFGGSRVNQQTLSIFSTGVASTNLLIKSEAGKTGPLIVVQDSALVSLFQVISNGFVGINNSTPGNRFTVNTPTTSVPSASALITAAASNQIPLVLEQAVGQLSNSFDIVTSAGSSIFNVSTSGRVSFIGGLSSSGTANGSGFSGNSINGQTLTLYQTSNNKTNLVLNSVAGAVEPILLINTTNGTSYIQVNPEGSMRIGTNALSALPFREILTGVATLNFASGIAGAQEDLPITVSGTTTNDVASIGVPFTAAANGGAFTPYTSNNTVYVRFSNATAGVVDPASAQFRATVIKY